MTLWEAGYAGGKVITLMGQTRRKSSSCFHRQQQRHIINVTYCYTSLWAPLLQQVRLEGFEQGYRNGKVMVKDW